MTQLFVYGSLLKGEDRDGLVAHLSARPATVPGRLWRAAAGYAALEVDPSGTPIHGEVLSIDKPALLTVLDMIEGTGPGLYSRISLTIQTRHGPEQAWAYVMDASQLRRAGCHRLKVSDWRRITRHRG